jgi:hypothetical protein
MLRQATFRQSEFQQGQDLEHFFTLAFDYAEKAPSQNVLDYAVKRTMSVKVYHKNWYRYETYLLKACRANQTTIPAVVQIFASYNALNYPLEKQRISKLICDLIRRSAPIGSHSEVAWSLFLAKALKIRLSAADVTPILEIESAACALILLDLRSLGLIDGVIDTSFWQQSMNADGLQSNNWLLAYEANIKGWLHVPAPNFVDSHPFFSTLKKYGVSFYDVKKNVKHIKSRKPKILPAINAQLQGLADITLTKISARFLDMSMAE